MAIAGQHSAPKSISNSIVRTGNFHGVQRFEIDLDYLPPADYLEFTLPSTHCTLVTNDGSPLCQQLVNDLKSNGEKVVVLNLPGVAQATNESAINLAASTDQAIGEAIAQVRQAYGKVGSFIHLHPQFEFQNGNFTQHFKAERNIVKTVFFLAKHLHADLTELGKSQRANFLCITRMDGSLGRSNPGNVSIVGGGLTGLVKCLDLEWSPVFCRATDIQPSLPTETIAKNIVAELHDANTAVVEVAISEQGRRTVSVQQTTQLENQEIKTAVTSDSVFLVSGGARGVTATCVIEMAKAFQCKFILLGRSSAEFELPAFATTENDEGALKRLIMNDLKEKGQKVGLPEVKRIFKSIQAKKEIDATLKAISDAGAQASYISGDVTKLSSYKLALDKVTAQYGQISGIIHGAGRLADKYIQDKSEADFEGVLSVKLDGLLSLLSSSNLNKLEHLILFSSVAGFYGNVGQTDYAIANEILSKAAILFKKNHPKTQVSAINWGAWDSGMVSGELKAQFEAAGITLVNSQGGAAMLVNELNVDYANQAQVIIGGTLPTGISHLGTLRTHRIRRSLQQEENPFLNHHQIKGSAVLPVVSAVAWMAHSAELLYPDFKVHKIDDTKLYKGIVFDGSEKAEYTLVLEETEKNENNIIFKASVVSAGAKLPLNHYSCTLVLRNGNAALAAPSTQHQAAANTASIDGASLYTNGALFHGEKFRGIKSIIQSDEKGMTLLCKAPRLSKAEQGQFPVHSVNSYFADIQYQGLLVWVQQFHDGAKSLPLSTDSTTIYRDIPFEKEMYVRLSVRENDQTITSADCSVYDENGEVYLETKGAKVTISEQLSWT